MQRQEIVSRWLLFLCTNTWFYVSLILGKKHIPVVWAHLKLVILHLLNLTGLTSGTSIWSPDLSKYQQGGGCYLWITWLIFIPQRNRIGSIHCCLYDAVSFWFSCFLSFWKTVKPNQTVSRFLTWHCTTFLRSFYWSSRSWFLSRECTCHLIAFSLHLRS